MVMSQKMRFLVVSSENYLLNWIVCREKFRQSTKSSDAQSHAEARSCNQKVMEPMSQEDLWTQFSTTRGVLNGITTVIRWRASNFFLETVAPPTLLVPNSWDIWGAKDLCNGESYHFSWQLPLRLSALTWAERWVGWDFKKLISNVEV